jgi:uncharacterized membrane protein
MLIVFPLGLLATSVIFDIVRLASGNGQWSAVSEYMIGAGVIGGLLAALFGLIDWLAIPSGTRAKVIGLWHGAGNVVVVALFIISWFLRLPAQFSAGSLPISANTYRETPSIRYVILPNDRAASVSVRCATCIGPGKQIVLAVMCTCT